MIIKPPLSHICYFPFFLENGHRLCPCERESVQLDEGGLQRHKGPSQHLQALGGEDGAIPGG